MGPPGVGGQSITLSLEAGEDLAVGDPVYVSANKFYKADNLVNHRIVGVVTIAASATFVATAVLSGQASLGGGLIPNSPYFLGAGIISATPPVLGYVVKVGAAINTATLIVNIEEPILLA